MHTEWHEHLRLISRWVGFGIESARDKRELIDVGGYSPRLRSTGKGGQPSTSVLEGPVRLVGDLYSKLKGSQTRLRKSPRRVRSHWLEKTRLGDERPAVERGHVSS